MNNYFYFFNSFCNLDTHIENKVQELNQNKLFDKYIFDQYKLLTKEKIIELQNILLSKNTNQFVIIKNFELLNKEIINSLLLILEEHKENIFFVFSSNCEEKILKTITSRCINIHLSFAKKEFDLLINKNQIKDESLIELFKFHFFSKKDLEIFINDKLNNFLDLISIIKNDKWDKLNTLLSFFKEDEFYLIKDYLFYWNYYFLNNKIIKSFDNLSNLVNKINPNLNRTLIFNQFLGIIILWKQL